MILTIKTLQNQKLYLDVDSTDTVWDIKQKIWKQFKICFPEGQKLILKGKILKKQDQTVESMHITIFDFMVVMVRRIIGIQIHSNGDDIIKMYKPLQLKQFTTLNQFLKDIAKSLKDDGDMFCKYYGIFLAESTFAFTDDNLRKKWTHWWPKSFEVKQAYAILEIKTKDKKLWYKQHFDKRCEYLIYAYIRIEIENNSNNSSLCVPNDIKKLCKMYLHQI
eukprot:532921_1